MDGRKSGQKLIYPLLNWRNKWVDSNLYTQASYWYTVSPVSVWAPSPWSTAIVPSSISPTTTATTTTTSHRPRTHVTTLRGSRDVATIALRTTSKIQIPATIGNKINKYDVYNASAACK